MSNDYYANFQTHLFIIDPDGYPKHLPGLELKWLRVDQNGKALVKLIASSWSAVGVILAPLKDGSEFRLTQKSAGRPYEYKDSYVILKLLDCHVERIQSHDLLLNQVGQHKRIDFSCLIRCRIQWVERGADA